MRQSVQGPFDRAMLASGQSVLPDRFCGNRRVGDNRRFLCFAKLAKAFRFAGALVGLGVYDLLCGVVRQ